jgi:hypothetical protein
VILYNKCILYNKEIVTIERIRLSEMIYGNSISKYALEFSLAIMNPAHWLRSQKGLLATGFVKAQGVAHNRRLLPCKTMELDRDKRLKSSDECWDEDQLNMAIAMSLQDDVKRKRTDYVNLGKCRSLLVLIYSR